jgi:hypothetical protein
MFRRGVRNASIRHSTAHCVRLIHHPLDTAYTLSMDRVMAQVVSGERGTTEKRCEQISAMHENPNAYRPC